MNFAEPGDGGSVALGVAGGLSPAGGEACGIPPDIPGTAPGTVPGTEVKIGGGGAAACVAVRKAGRPDFLRGCAAVVTEAVCKLGLVIAASSARKLAWPRRAPRAAFLCRDVLLTKLADSARKDFLLLLKSRTSSVFVEAIAFGFGTCSQVWQCLQPVLAVGNYEGRIKDNQANLGYLL